MTLRHRVVGVFVALGVLAVLTAVVVGHARSEREREFALFTDLYRTERQIDDIERCVQDHHRQITLIVQTFAGGTDQGVEPSLRQQVTDAGAVCRAVAHALATDPGDEASRAARGALASAVDQLFDDWDFVISHLGVDQVSAITRQAMSADPRALALLTTGLPAMRAERAEQLALSRDSLLRTGMATDRWILLSVLSSLGIAGLSLVIVLRRVMESLDRLAVGAARFRGGDFAHRVPEDGKDEFTAVVTQINAMAGQIAKDRVELERRATDLQVTIDTLSAARDALVHQEKMAALGELVAGVAHEVNTPLGVAVTTGSLVQDHLVQLRQHAEAGTATRGLVRRVVNDAELAAALMVENLRRAADLVRSFKQVAVDRGDVTVRAARLEEWVRALLHSLSPLARHHRVTLVVDVPQDANLVLAAGELEQIVTNLVVNGCVHAYPETVVSTLDRRVELSARYDDAALTLEVRDRGRGMMPEEVAHVFEPFFTTRRGQGGTGLGMHVVHQLVRERFDGTIDLDSRPGAGTRWTVRLPFDTAALRLLGVPTASATPLDIAGRDTHEG